MQLGVYLTGTMETITNPDANGDRDELDQLGM